MRRARAARSARVARARNSETRRGATSGRRPEKIAGRFESVDSEEEERQACLDASNERTRDDSNVFWLFFLFFSCHPSRQNEHAVNR
jgi:hypothetical protein